MVSGINAYARRAGYDEYFEPNELIPNNAGITRFDLQAPYKPYSIINQSLLDKYPESAQDTLTHERIHQGQMASGVNLSLQAVFDTMRNYITPEEFNYNANRGHTNQPALEPPAYAFSSSNIYPEKQDVQQDAFNKYIAALNENTKGEGYNVVAAAPKGLQKGYIPGIPKPILNLPDDLGLVDLIKSYMAGRKAGKK